MINKSFDFLNGEILLINKPYKWTSFDVVSKVRNLIKEKYLLKKIKIGHAGTLDPLATGLLIICTGRFTKKIESFQNLDKEYTGTFTLGATTPCGDLEKQPDTFFDISNITEEILHETSKKLTGEILQKAPVFSAKKINGIRAYELARKGTDVDIKPNLVNIKVFEITQIRLPEIDFRVVCSKGTYIRSLAIDFGTLAGTGAYLSSLCRTKIGEYSINDSISPEEFIKIIQNLSIH